MKLDLILAVIVALVVLTFMAQNYESVNVDFLIWSASLPRAVLLLGVFLGGVLVGWIIRRFPKL